MYDKLSLNCSDSERQEGRGGGGGGARQEGWVGLHKGRRYLMDNFQK